ncbi:hypothetical protein AMTR_s00070p00177620 [Amborella trichopoda]|uniref:Uncharacterized protein n=1 Tax=Amborella trichopoda TaxID=13333 RepID=U5DDN4_AMBTC|nr:hypothetical protein AMTR_s00070p00177620 [Amborella trichopoda]
MGWVTKVISDAKLISAAACGVDICIGRWRGKIDLWLSVVPVDDYQVVLGMDFFSSVKGAHALCKLSMYHGGKGLHAWQLCCKMAPLELKVLRKSLGQVAKGWQEGP